MFSIISDSIYSTMCSFHLQNSGIHSSCHSDDKLSAAAAPEEGNHTFASLSCLLDLLDLLDLCYAKDNEWNPPGYVHMDKLENLTHEVNTDDN